MRGKLWISSILTAALAAAILPNPILAQPAPAPLAADPVQQAVTDLGNARLSPEARAAAARRLVAARSQPSRQATVGILSDSRIPDSQAAVAQALADAPTPDRDPSFVDPLFTMLQTPGTPGLKAAQALGIYKIGPAHDKQVLPRLIGTATGAAAVRTDTIRANATLGG